VVYATSLLRMYVLSNIASSNLVVGALLIWQSGYAKDCRSFLFRFES
jgi:hypothetical protein